METLLYKNIDIKDLCNVHDAQLINLLVRQYDQKRKPVQYFIKRFLDVSLSLIGLIMISPLLLLIAILVKIDSKGPIIYKQRRIGLNKKIFYMYKFRTMKVGAENEEDCIRKFHKEDNVIMFKIKNDPRITKIGKFLRKYSLDELPQLFNVLKGEMSLVGPRPRVEKDLAQFKNWHYIFFAAMPGITGMWQTNGRSAIKDFDKVVSFEYNYIKNWNLLLDFSILFKTIPVVISGANAS